MDSVAEGLSLGITLFQLVGSYDKNIATSSSIKYIDLDFTVNYVSNEKFVFVKRYGAGDSEQILCYVGNNVISEVMTSYSADIYANGVIIQPSSQQKNISVQFLIRTIIQREVLQQKIIICTKIIIKHLTNMLI